MRLEYKNRTLNSVNAMRLMCDKYSNDNGYAYPKREMYADFAEICRVAIDDLKRNEPVPPKIKRTHIFTSVYCPKCDALLDSYRMPKYCSCCGQAVKWDE